MSPIRRGDVYYVYVPKQKGGALLRTTGTTEKRTYTLVKALVARLKSERRWSILNAITAHPPRTTVGKAYDADRTKSLDAFEAALSAEALAPHVTKYLAVLKGRGKSERHIQNVKQQLAQFMVKHATTADLTNASVTAWLATLTMSPGTCRQYCFAVTGLTRYLVDVDVLKEYPLNKVTAPDKNPARMTYYDAATDERIVLASHRKYRALFAFVKGTACDLTTALTLNRQDIDWAGGKVRLRGTKTAQRDVHEALIEGWAYGYVQTHCESVMPFSPLFPGLTRHGAYRHHRRCCKALGITGYTLKDARHSVAVRMAKQGYTASEIAEQLGNSPDLCARVYARFIVKMAHRVTESVTRTSMEAK